MVGERARPLSGCAGSADLSALRYYPQPFEPGPYSGRVVGRSGVAAALNLGFLHQGSDGGGSIRIPASFTGTFGFKPTFGLVPQWPASAMSILVADYVQSLC
ncbi:amidase family protein [Phyllobacterium sophorae]|uniref:amidase family protein n=1 Tax=Phyllobacterium sophorae TaxID=1520277 RepID=UPI0011B265BF